MTGDVKMALSNGRDIEVRTDEAPYASRLALGWCRKGALHVAVRDNIDDDEIIIDAAYEPSLEVWEPDLVTRRKRRR